MCSEPTIRRRTEAASADFIHVSDLAQAHRAALSYLRGKGASATLNCGYGRGYSVLETIEAVRRVPGAILRSNMHRAGRRYHDHGGGHQPHPGYAGLDAAIRQSRDHRRPRAGVEKKLFRQRSDEVQHAESAVKSVGSHALLGLKNVRLAGKESSRSRR